MNSRSSALVVVFAGLSGVIVGQGRPVDWPQWRGPNRDGSVLSFTPPSAWPEKLTQKWKVDVGLGTLRRSSWLTASTCSRARGRTR